LDYLISILKEHWRTDHTGKRKTPPILSTP
jgi:hypothetical protein